MLKHEGEGNFKSKKIRLRFFFASFFTLMVITNVLFGWALPNIIVECAQDIFIEFINSTFADFSHFKNLTAILVAMFLVSDLIFVYSVYNSIIIKGDARFTCKLISIIMLKIIIDLTFFHYNIYSSLDLENFRYYSLTNYLTKHSNSLFSLSISIQFLCTIQNYKNSNVFIKIFLIVSLSLNSFYYLFSNIFFTFQIIFSFLVTDYVNRLIQ